MEAVVIGVVLAAIPFVFIGLVLLSQSIKARSKAAREPRIEYFKRAGQATQDKHHLKSQLNAIARDYRRGQG